jgi:hypothetical protein
MTVSESKESSWCVLGDVVGSLMSSLANSAVDQRPGGKAYPVKRTKR